MQNSLQFQKKVNFGREIEYYYINAFFFTSVWLVADNTILKMKSAFSLDYVYFSAFT